MSDFHLTIRKVTVLLRDGTDLVVISTNLPPTMPKSHKTSPSLQFDVAKDRGIAYVQENFGVTPEVVDSRVPREKFSRSKS